MESATWDANNFFACQVFNRDRAALWLLKTGTKTTIWAIAPDVDFTALCDRTWVALTSTDLHHSHIWKLDYLGGHQDIFLIAVTKATLFASAPREKLLFLSDAHGV